MAAKSQAERCRTLSIEAEFQASAAHKLLVAVSHCEYHGASSTTVIPMLLDLAEEKAQLTLDHVRALKIEHAAMVTP